MNTLYDVNTFIGHWPFRQVNNSTPVELRLLLESYGIKKALTANINSIFYKDAHSGNQELAERISDNRDFFSGVAILNPTYVAWERDLETCVNDFEFKALRLVPQYHNYQFGDLDCIAICQKAADLNIPVLISPTMVDPRQKHWLDVDESIGLKQVCDLAAQIDSLQVICTGYLCNPNDYDYLSKLDCRERIFLDASKCLRSAFYQHLAYGIKKLGATQFIFGSNAPMRGITPSILVLESEEISAAEKAIIVRQTFDKLFE